MYWIQPTFSHFFHFQIADRYIKYVTVQKLTAAGLKRVGPHVEADCANSCRWYLRMQSSVSNESLFAFSACSKNFSRAMNFKADHGADLATLVFPHDFKGWNRNLPGVLEVIADVEELEAHRRLVVKSSYFQDKV